MPVTNTVDEVVNDRPVGAPRGLPARTVQEETVAATGGAAKITRSGIEDENHSTAGRQRVLKESTAKLLEKIEKGDGEDKDPRAPAPHEEGDPDEDEEAAGEDEDAGDADGESGDDAGGDEGEPSEPGDDDEGAEGDKEGGDEAPPDIVQTNARLSARNRELLAELEEARKTPKSERNERETALTEALDAYYDGGSVAAFRKFLSVVVGAPADSKEVDAELSGVFLDLSEKEVGVPLDSNQRALRDNARTRLALAKDKRDKADAAKKPVVDNSVDIGIEHGARMIEGLLTTKAQEGTPALADEYPKLMALAEHLDGYKPGELLARAIQREILSGDLDPKTLSDIEMIRTVAPKIEKHYEAVAKRISAATNKNTKTDTTKPSVKPKVATQASTEQRQSTGARTLTNATASRAPAKPPKTTPKPKTTTENKARKDFPTDDAWKEYLLAKHLPR